MKIRDRIKELRRVRAGDLIPDEANWRVHPDSQVAAMNQSLAEIGYADALLVRPIKGKKGKTKYKIIDGHLRAGLDPDQPVPVLVLDVNEKEAKKLLATLDPIAGMAERNNEALAGLLKDLAAMGDKLNEVVWPDYIREALLSADWKPDAITSLDGHKRDGEKPFIEFTTEQYEIVMRGIDAVRTRESADPENMPDGRALELLVADWLS